jgi:hypothetical protein
MPVLQEQGNHRLPRLSPCDPQVPDTAKPSKLLFQVTLRDPRRQIAYVLIGRAAEHADMLGSARLATWGKITGAEGDHSH